jgi:uncharacterized protein (UPF0335 family)
MATVGHNSGSVAGPRLKSFIDRLETLDERKTEIMADMKEVFSEAKGEGFDVKPIRKLLALRKRDRDKVVEDKAILELYADAIGYLDLV